VEQVMSVLIEACGDAKFIDIEHNSLMDAIGEEALLSMSSSQMETLKTKFQDDTA
jgi:hypothetical protein